MVRLYECEYESVFVSVCVAGQGGEEGNIRPNNSGQCLGQEVGADPGPFTRLLCGRACLYEGKPPASKLPAF